MCRVASLIAALIIVPAAFACDFQYDPASVTTYYRVEGWSLPGVKDFNPEVMPRINHAPLRAQVDGTVAQVLPHNEDPYIVAFPTQEFVLNGARQKSRSLQAMAVVVRWMMDGHTIAYSYDLIPVTAHRMFGLFGRWRVESEMACTFTVTFVDDKGDGIFRTLVPGPLTTDLVPRWARPPQD